MLQRSPGNARFLSFCLRQEVGFAHSAWLSSTRMSRALGEFRFWTCCFELIFTPCGRSSPCLRVTYGANSTYHDRSSWLRGKMRPAASWLEDVIVHTDKQPAFVPATTRRSASVVGSRHALSRRPHCTLLERRRVDLTGPVDHAKGPTWSECGLSVNPWADRTERHGTVESNASCKSAHSSPMDSESFVESCLNSTGT